MNAPWISALSEARTRKDEAHDARVQLVELTREAGALERKLAESRARLAREEADVARLRGLSWSAMLHALLGDAERELRREEREVVEAQFHAEEAEQELERARAEREALEERLRELGDVDAAYEQALVEAERSALAAKGPVRAELRRLAKNEGKLASADRRIERARRKGEAALGKLEAIRDQLGTAQSWSALDVVGGGGLIVSLIKHRKIDAAQRLMVEARHDLARFGRGLARVAEDAYVEVEFPGFTRFEDAFVDFVYHDFIVAQRLNAAWSTIAAGIADVGAQLERLRAEQARITATLAEIAVRRRALLEGQG